MPFWDTAFAQMIDLSQLERGARKTIGRQGVDPDQMKSLLRHVYKDRVDTTGDLRTIFAELRADPMAVEIAVKAVARDPITVDDFGPMDPEFPYTVVDGHHRATMLQQLGVRQVPAVIQKRW